MQRTIPMEKHTPPPDWRQCAKKPVAAHGCSVRVRFADAEDDTLVARMLSLLAGQTVTNTRLAKDDAMC